LRCKTIFDDTIAGSTTFALAKFTNSRFAIVSKRMSFAFFMFTFFSS
jgi:hypothetical protein